MFSHGKRTAEPCMHNAAPAMQRTCLESRWGWEQWGLMQTGRYSLFVFLVSIFTVFFSVAVLPLCMQGRGPHERRLWSLGWRIGWRIMQRAGVRVWKLPGGVNSSTHAYILKFPRTNQFPRNKKATVPLLAVVTIIALLQQCSQALVSQESNCPVSTHTSLYHGAQWEGKASSLESKPSWVQILETGLVSAY